MLLLFTLAAARRPALVKRRFPRQPDDQIGIDSFDAAVPYQVIGPIKILHRMTAVSYTHLDVYKRQHLPHAAVSLPTLPAGRQKYR